MDFCLGKFCGVENSNIFFTCVCPRDKYNGNVYNYKHVLSIISIHVYILTFLLEKCLANMAKGNKLLVLAIGAELKKGSKSFRLYILVLFYKGHNEEKKYSFFS